MENKKLGSFLKNKEKYIVALGLAGMLLILFSSINLPEKQPKTTDYAAADYAKVLQKQLEETLKSVEGVGKVKVMLTVEGSAEYVYAQDEKQTLDEQQDFDNAQNISRAQRKEDSQKSYIFVEGSNRQALKIKEIEPKVRGVVVVCQGASSPVVALRVTEAVTTLLGIGPSQVCVVLYTDK